ncbi:DUF3810 domain-containing protein [Flavobacterium sp. CS20]|uniref:DUF3810 domain-containing protein n=1 Tax=Flavobacterium sp. CS20 TaxID=2775246 RepID=UPI001B3A7AEE|nr:DUF3810 domain-containing protein [Flavobacterium sp. CS20]QTY27169.1 DUF3810 domain-containing protein [Flavobacterium sp. CS20]
MGFKHQLFKHIKTFSKLTIWQKSRLVWSIFLPVQLFLIYSIKPYPEAIEMYYSNGIYISISTFFQHLFSHLPFSFGDIFYIILIAFIIKYLVGVFKRKFKLKKSDFYKIVSFISIIYFWFHISWGLNYYRLPLHKQLGVKSDYNTEELISFTEKLLVKANAIHHKLVANDTLPVHFEQSENEYEKMAFENFKRTQFQDQYVEVRSIKPSLLSLPLSYMGFGGYLNPFTHEAQYNDRVPKYKFPTLIAHEMGHQLGYAKENEYNFVSCYVNMHSTNEKIRYAGFTYALKFCLNEVYWRSPEDFERLKAEVNPGILKNYKETQIFWESFKNPLEPVFKNVYGNFLKVNNQPQGIQSYNYVVALLVNYFSKNSLP